MLMFTGVAFADPAADDPAFVAPTVAADLFRATSGPAPGAEPSARLTGQVASLTAVYTRAPLVWRGPDRSVPVVGDVLAARVAAAAGLGPLALEVEVPAYLVQTGVAAGDTARIGFAGDPSVGVRWTPVSGVGAASVFGRVTPSLGASAVALGEPGATGALGVAAGWRSGALGGGADVALWARPRSELAFGGPTAIAGAYLLAAVGPVEVSVGARGWAPLDAPEAAPIEGTVGVATAGQVRAFASGGVGLRDGIGAPAARAALGVSVRSRPPR